MHIVKYVPIVQESVNKQTEKPVAAKIPCTGIPLSNYLTSTTVCKMLLIACWKGYVDRQARKYQISRCICHRILGLKFIPRWRSVCRRVLYIFSLSLPRSRSGTAMKKCCKCEGCQRQLGKTAYTSRIDFGLGHLHTWLIHRAMLTSFFIISMSQGCESISLGDGRSAGITVRLR